MRKQRRTFLRILVASPSDTTEERVATSRAITTLSKLHGQKEGFVLESLLWEEDSYPGVGVDGQDVINREFGDYQILIGIMKTRFGTPTHRAGSGTEEEFDRAMDRFFAQPNEIRILFYFHNAPVKFLDIDIEQAVKVHAFRRRVQAQGLLVREYANTAEFERMIHTDLLRAVMDLLQPTAPTPLPAKVHPTPQAVSYGNWHATYRKSAPQGATYRPLSIAQYGRSPICLTGVFQSSSPYFRFGFKLLGLRARPFSAGSVQTEDHNLLVHIGRNISSTEVRLIHYRNGMRVGTFTPILKYEDCRSLPIELTIATDYAVALRIERETVFEAYIDAEIKAQLLLLAWGDEHDYVVDFNDITLHVD